MSSKVKCDIEEYREEHESDEHWELRKAFIERWKDNYSEERLLCLARVFANIEFMGCRYPTEVMQEVAQLSKEVAKNYRTIKKTKLQRTFISASEAAVDRAKGIKRKGGIVKDSSVTKCSRIQFVPQSKPDETSIDNTCNNNNIEKQSIDNINKIIDQKPTIDNKSSCEIEDQKVNINNKSSCEIEDEKVNIDNKLDSDTKAQKKQKKELNIPCPLRKTEAISCFMNEMAKVKCLNIDSFKESMFWTKYGKFILIVRPWDSHLINLHASCGACKIPLEAVTDATNQYTVKINGVMVASASGVSNQDAKNRVNYTAWNKLINEVVILLTKESLVQDRTAVSYSDVSRNDKKKLDEMFGTPLDNTVATKMMKLMGWKGGGLGVDSQGIAEPIKPHLQMVQRAGLGSTSSNIHHLRQSANKLMQRYVKSDSLEIDLVFTSEFSKEERAVLHTVARKYKLLSRSYGRENYDRFLVIKKRVDPFTLVRSVIKQGGETQKYKIFLPEKLKDVKPNNN